MRRLIASVGNCPTIRHGWQTAPAVLQSQEASLVLGHFGLLPPLCAPPTTKDRSFSSSVRSVSFDRVNFLFFMTPPLDIWE